MKFLLTIILGICSFTVSAEELPTFSIVQLSIFSDKIVEAQLLEEKDGTCIFLTRPLGTHHPFSDTLVTGSLPGFEDTTHRRIEPQDSLVIYLTSHYEQMTNKTEVYPMLSGVRLLKNDAIYFPFQRENPGGMNFVSMINDSLTWTELKRRILAVDERINKVKSLRTIADPVEKNKAIFQFIQANKYSFWEEGQLHEDRGWGSLVWEVFDWITETNIAVDTWAAFELNLEMNNLSKDDWRKNTGNLQDKNGNSFTTYKDIDFLIKIAMSEQKPMIHRTQALRYLGAAVKKVYENNYPIPDSTQLAFQTQKQKAIRDIIFELLDHPILQLDAFGVVSVLSNPRDGALTHRIDLERMATIVDIYKKEKHSSFKSSLADFIHFNSSEKTWKEISGNDAKIYFSLSTYITVDTIRNKLILGVGYRNGKPAINELPKVMIQGVTNQREPILMEIDPSRFQLPYNSHQGGRQLRLDLGTLEKGQYQVWLEGTAGVNNEFEWKSEIGGFRLE